MPNLTKKEFAALCGIKTNRLSVEITRSKVVLGADGKIDTNNETNTAFRTRVQATQENKAQQMPREETWVDSDGADDEPADESGIDPLVVSDKKYKHYLAEKTKRASELDGIRIEKAKGILIPSAPIIPIFLRHNQFIMQEQKNADEEILSMYAHKYDITPEDMAYIRGEQVKRRNAAAERAAEMSEKNIANTINEFSEKKRVA